MFVEEQRECLNSTIKHSRQIKAKARLKKNTSSHREHPTKVVLST